MTQVWTGAVTAILPTKDAANRLAEVLAQIDYTADDMHVTVTYIGGKFVSESAVEAHRIEAQKVARRTKPFSVSVSGVGFLGPNNAIVAHIGSPELSAMNKRFEKIKHSSPFKEYIPHITLGYNGNIEMVNSQIPETIPMGYIAVLSKGVQHIYPLSG
jgi:2'-5' RNA ligase